MPAATASVEVETGSPSEALREAFWNLKAKRVRISPCHTTRASSIGHGCERFLTYERTQSEMRLPPSVELQAIFDLGNNLETYVLRELEEMGIGVYQRGRDYEDKRYEITGHVDAKLQVLGRRIPAEIKGLNPFTAGSISTIEDIRDHKQAWVRKYYSQLQLYLFLDNSPLGVFILLNKVSGVLMFIDCPLDYEHAESLLKKAERIKAHVHAGTLPERTLSDECQRCPFVHVCKPDLNFGPGVDFWDSAEVEAMLQRRAELEPLRREFESLDKTIKKQAPQKPELLCGDFALTGKWVERKAYEVAASRYWQISIERLKGAGNGADE